MARPDGSELDAAVVDRLQADATLAALLPDGVYIDEAKPNCKRFAIVSVLDAVDEDTWDATGFETVTYAILAVGVTTAISGPEIRAAAARIDALLHGQALTVPGYPVPATLARTHRLRPPVVVDAEDPSIRWYQRGGHYELFASR